MLLLLLVGCPKQPAPAEVAVQSWAPPPSVVEYTRLNVAGPFPLPDVRVREEWSGPTLDGDLAVYEITTFDVTSGAPRRIETTRAFYGPDGFGWLGTVEGDGFVPWTPPQVVLPAAPAVGATWTATHDKAGVTSTRSCELLASEVCEGGIVSVCDSERKEGRIVLRDHFCPGVGWSGFEALVLGGGKPEVRMWSEEVVRDGLRLSE